ncbi:hypothetical protein PVA19_11240 [Agrobacterium sp. CNPSo 3708]|uniref:hypothetical protein n=1 Tax=Agrobacterium sp. CNPSo 3708 TaxID=3028150 RepID=UPI0023635D7B|nr:hypothetical protein [Agrobacterium sp. CNPSo 3708]MDD1498986.1 hypothetical protein [Agrobacterium sp. CNPSo 3708]
MSTSTTTTRPTHHVFVVEGEGKDAFWNRIGAAWQHTDGQGFNMTLNAVPLNGRIVVRSVKAAGDRTGKGRK